MADKHTKSRELDVSKTKGDGALTVKINIDVSEALSGLKAVERQAKKATQALKELETYYGEDGKRYYVKWRQQGDYCTDIREVCMSVIPTEYLQRELAQREGSTSAINGLRDVQGQDGNWNNDEYMCGLFNGLELASATLEGRTPEYRDIGEVPMT